MGLQSWDTGLWQVLVLCMFVCSLKTPKLQARHKKNDTRHFSSLSHATFRLCLPHAEAYLCAAGELPLGVEHKDSEKKGAPDRICCTCWISVTWTEHFTILILKRNLEIISFPISLARTPVYGRQNLSLEPASPLCELVSCEHNTEQMEEHRSSD